MSDRLLRNKIDLVLFYTRARLESEVVRNYVGYLWWILDPLLAVGVYYVVFELILNRGGPDYIPFLFIGMIAWKWFQAAVQKGSMAIHAQKSLYKKIYLPKIIFPWIELNFHSVKFLAILGFLLIIYPIWGFHVSVNHLYLPIVFLAQYIFTLGLITLLTSLTPFFPDSGMIIGHILRLAFYPSGVIFAIERVPEKYRFLMYLNPVSQSVQSFRDIVMYHKEPRWSGLLLLGCLGILLYIVGSNIIRKLDGNYAKLN